MRINLRKKKNLTDEQLEIISTKDFFDRIVPGIIQVLHRPLYLRKLLQVLLGGNGISDFNRRNGYPRSPCRQERT